MQANAMFWRLSKADGTTAIGMFEAGVERYPDYAPAQSMLAFALLASRLFGWTAEPQLKLASVLATRGIRTKRQRSVGAPRARIRGAQHAARFRGGRIRTRHHTQSKFCRCSWLPRLYAFAGRPNGPGDRASGASDAHESPRSTKCDFQQRHGGRTLSCRSIRRGDRILKARSACIMGYVARRLSYHFYRRPPLKCKKAMLNWRGLVRRSHSRLSQATWPVALSARCLAPT